MEICSGFSSIHTLWLSQSSHKTIYFDCIHPDNYPLEGPRPEKYKKYCEDEKCKNDAVIYNFTKRFLNKEDYVDKNETNNVPLVLYYGYDGYTSMMDWCPEEPPPERYIENGTDEKKILEIGDGDQAILSELQSQNNATAVAFKAILEKLESQNHVTADGLKSILEKLESQNKELKTQIKKLKAQNNATADGFKAIVSELQSLKNLTSAQSHRNDHVNHSGSTYGFCKFDREKLTLCNDDYFLPELSPREVISPS